MRTPIKTLAATLFLVVFAGLLAVRAEVEVQAKISSRNGEVGEPLQFQIEISGAQHVPDAPVVEVDGADVKYAGPSRRVAMEMINGRFSQRMDVTHVFRLEPRREGELQIPAIAVDVDGKTYHTQPIGLKVAPRNTQGRPVTDGNGDAVVWAEIVPARKTAYVGEALPIEIRVYYDDNRISRPQLETRPNLVGDGFTRQKITDPERRKGEKDGRNFTADVMRTAITASKPGKITLGPSDFTALVSVSDGRRRRSPIDIFDDDDFFSGFFGGRTQRVQVRAGAVEIEVKPLPTAGRPADFTGAVGKFEFRSEGKPSQVKIGDPVTMHLTLSGTGNFDRIGEPKIVDGSGWQTYPPSKNFEAADEVGITGNMTWDIAVIPEVRKDRMPRFAFNYFDPEAERYVALTTPEEPLIVTGDPLPEKPVAAANSATPAPNEATASTEEDDAAKKPELAPLRQERGKSRTTFAPVYERAWFWWMQTVPAAIALALLGWRFGRKSESEARAARLTRERNAEWNAMEEAQARADFYEHAARVLQLDTALRCNREPSSIDAGVICETRSLNEEEAALVQSVFDERAELVFAGSFEGERQRVSSSDRDRVRRVLGQLINQRMGGKGK